MQQLPVPGENVRDALGFIHQPTINPSVYPRNLFLCGAGPETRETLEFDGQAATTENR
jgi:hypothetical protein